MDDPVDPARLARLTTMAASLGIPIGSFFAETEATERLAEARECARLWDRIKTVEDRRRALAYLRELAGEPNP